MEKQGGGGERTKKRKQESEADWAGSGSCVGRRECRNKEWVKCRGRREGALQSNDSLCSEWR